MSKCDFYWDICLMFNSVMIKLKTDISSATEKTGHPHAIIFILYLTGFLFYCFYLNALFLTVLRAF